MGTATEAREARDELHEYCTNDVKLTAHLALLHEPYLRRNIEITENTNILGGVETQPSAVLYLFRWKVKPMMPKSRSPTRMHKNTASRRYVRLKYVSFVVMHVDIAAMRNFDPSASDEGISKTPYLFQKKCDRPVLPKKMIFLSRFF